MKIIEAVTEEPNNTTIYITRELQNMLACSDKAGRPGLTGVKWAGSKGYVWVTNGHVLVMRPMGYSYTGDDWDIHLEGEFENSAPPAIGTSEFFSIDTQSIVFPPQGEGHPRHVEQFVTSKGKVLRVILSRKEVFAWPDIESVVHPAAAVKDYRSLGMDLQLIRDVAKGLGTRRVELRVPKGPIDPVMIHPIGDTEAVVITAGGENVFTKFGIAMPTRID